jgi:hypothetical protein
MTYYIGRADELVLHNLYSLYIEKLCPKVLVIVKSSICLKSQLGILDRDILVVLVLATCGRRAHYLEVVEAVTYKVFTILGRRITVRRKVCPEIDHQSAVGLVIRVIREDVKGEAKAEKVKVVDPRRETRPGSWTYDGQRSCPQRSRPTPRS